MAVNLVGDVGARRVDTARLIDNSKFNSFTLSVATICFLAIVFDGLDSALFGTLLPVLMKDLKMGPVEAGLLASIGHVGAVGGAVIFGVAADAVGRKKMMLIGIAVFTVFTAACGLAQGFLDFAIYRFIAGFGLAGIVPIAVALVFEYTPGRKKAMVSSLSYMGIAVGVLLSALLAIALLPAVGWRALLTGTSVCALLVPVAALLLPESMSILVQKERKEGIRKILKKVDPRFVSQADDVYVATKLTVARVSLAHLLRGQYARNTVCLGIALLCLMLISVTLTTWVAQLMVQRGFTLATGITFILVFSASNFISTPLAGWMSDRIGYKKVFLIYMPVMFISISLIGIVQSEVTALICMFFAGFSALGATCLLLPYAGSLYPLSVRSSAMGVVYAIGRTGPILGPAIAGAMLGAGMSVPFILVCIAAPSFVALISFLVVEEAPLVAVAGSLPAHGSEKSTFVE